LRIPSALVVARSNSQGIFVFKITMEKKCTKCGVVKSLDNFGRHKGQNDGKRSHCKSCCKHYDKIYRQNNKEKIKISKQDNKEKIKEYNKEYYKNNKDKVNKNQREYYKNNKDKVKETQKIYIKKNKGKNREYLKKYLKERRKTDFLFRLRGNISANIKESLKIKGYTKKTKTYNILKCEYDFFMTWLNGIASNGYTYGVGDLQLDHVVPTSLATTEQEMIILNHYSNFQLLSADENRSKGNRCVNPTNLKRVLEHHPEPNKIKEIYSRL